VASRIGELLGSACGVLLAPALGALSALRRARVLHPSGITCHAEVTGCGEGALWGLLGARLEGPALVRLSGAIWKEREGPDVLGLALRFTRSSPLVFDERTCAEPRPGDQDLLLATVWRPWTLFLGPFTTRPHDFLANRYYAVSPFRVRGMPGPTPACVGAIEWRAVPVSRAPGGRSRAERLAAALARGEARWTLEARPYRRVIDVLARRAWHPVAQITLLEPVAVDQAALRFDPFRAGRGIEPVGFIHALRRASYGASQYARPRESPGASAQRARAEGVAGARPANGPPRPTHGPRSFSAPPR
jgi:hypothetical protein